VKTIHNTARLRRRILSHDAVVGVVGQGYVGLSLACAAADVGFGAIGIDVDARRVEDLSAGRLTVPGVDETLYHRAVATGRVDFATEPERLAKCDVILICVPTPVRDGTPDLSFVEVACRQTAEHLSRGALVILESTTYPGTTEERVQPLLETSGLRGGTDFLLAYSPERIDPGNGEYGLQNTPKIVGGVTPEATGAATLFYEQLTEKVVVVSSCRAAELAKLLENAFRHVNIALVNEMAMLCRDMDIDVWEVVDAAATKPFGFLPFYPGPGVGGHCIPLDSAYLAWQVRREAGRQFRMLELAEDVNGQMPSYVAMRIGEALNDAGKSVKSAHILVLGVTYKADVGDLRESPALKVISHLVRRGAEITYHDPFVDEIVVNSVVLARSELTERLVAGADCVVVLTPHHAYDLSWIAEHAALVFDARNASRGVSSENLVRL
jgi:UDP-N-acetyl-D-glucosamine dehydrogenase